MRLACVSMIARKRSRAGRVIAGGPRNVSTKPSSEASGVRSSWLALATKSTRIRSRFRVAVWSSKTISVSPSPARATCTAKARSTGSRSSTSSRRDPTVARAGGHGFQDFRIAQGKAQRLPGAQEMDGSGLREH